MIEVIPWDRLKSADEREMDDLQYCTLASRRVHDDKINSSLAISIAAINSFRVWKETVLHINHLFRVRNWKRTAAALWQNKWVTKQNTKTILIYN